MGCGQSKINLYPRRNKNGGKGNSAKKSGAVDKETDEEEGSAAQAGVQADDPEDEEHGKQLLPLSGHPSTIEISESQQDFFKMLDERIEKGKDYDSSSETEVQIEQERRKILIDQWRSASQSTQSSFSQSSPSTPARRHVSRPQPPERHSSPGATRRCYRQQHILDGMSPPPRRAHSAQHQPDSRQLNGDSWMREEPNKSSVKRPQSAGANWKNNPKVVPYSQKPKKNEVNEHQRSIKDFDTISNSAQDISQITYNPTFQTHSPAHSTKSQQPYIAQIVSYPVSQQVTPPSTPKYIAPPEEYQDPQNNILDNKYATSPHPTGTSPGTPNSQSNIYYIHGNVATNLPQDIHQQRQQTALHLQQYVAMKQAQQQMFSYIQRSPHSVYPSPTMAEHTAQRDPSKIYDHSEEYAQYSHTVIRPHSAPAPVGIVRPMPLQAGPVLNPIDGAHVAQVPMWSTIPAVVSSMGPWIPGHDMQYYPQAQYTHQMYRANSAGSAGTMTRYHKDKIDDGSKSNMCQSINLVRQKPVGQIVMGIQELTVNTNTSESPSPASVSTDSGVSPGNSAPSSKNSVFSTPSSGSVKDNSVVIAIDTKNKKNKTVPFGRPLKNSKSLDSS